MQVEKSLTLSSDLDLYSRCIEYFKFNPEKNPSLLYIYSKYVGFVELKHVAFIKSKIIEK